MMLLVLSMYVIADNTQEVIKTSTEAVTSVSNDVNTTLDNVNTTVENVTKTVTPVTQSVTKAAESGKPKPAPAYLRLKPLVPLLKASKICSRIFSDIPIPLSIT